MVNTHETEPSDLPAEPPAKRRRGIAGSIVSTAVSAALIGSAVGLTVYRLWRDRGKDTTQSIAPPPPYQEASWPDSSKSNEPSVVVTPATPLSHSRGRKSRNQHVNSPGSTLARRRRRVRPHGSAGFSPQPHQQAFFPNPQPEFTFGAPSVSAGDEDGDEQMDALSSRLTYLIEQGKKALRTEVVVGSERQEDLVDDGEGDWIDDEVEASTSQSRQRSASRRRSNRSGANTPREAQFGFNSNPMAIPDSAQRSQYSHAQPSASFTPASPFINGFSASPSPSTSFREDPSNWSSDIMRESMERARARAQERATGSSGQFGR
ncbi:hypothetical protein DL96DRAFT_1583789 [Flagelloscypha sp. PMI_526]|nr:hypothetical protein DL96DRAFT_1583789 [Flagelloscypha sp. PMI_526]